MSKYALETLFSSKPRIKLLKLFFRNTEGLFSLEELAERTQETPSVIRRELENFIDINLVNKVHVKTQKAKKEA